MACDSAMKSLPNNRPSGFAAGLTRIGVAAIVACSLVLVGGCSPKPQVSATTSQTNWSWATYPTVEKMRLASLPCQILPRTSLAIHSPIAGQLRLYIDRPQTNLPADFLWAEFEPKSLKMEADELAEAKSKIDERERLFDDIELPKEKIKLNKEIAEAKKDVAILSLLATNAELARLAINAAGLNKDGTLQSETLDQAKEELDLLHRNMKFLSTTNSAVMGIDLQGARMEWERRQLEFDRRESQSRFKMPFAGQLIATLPLTEGVKEYPVSAGQELAVIRNLNTILLKVPLEDVSWSGLPTAKLTAVLFQSDGSRLEASFAFKKLEEFQLREEIFYYFQFPPEESAAAALLLGTSPTCELWLELSQPARIVPKLALVLHEPTAFQNRHWNEGLSHILPGAQVLVEGQTDLAILPPVAGTKPDNNSNALSRLNPNPVN